MSICVTARCRDCEHEIVNVQINDRRHYEKYGYVCDPCFRAKEIKAISKGMKIKR